MFQNKLIIGCGGRPGGRAAVLSLDGDNWGQIGGNGISGSWSPKIFRQMNKPLFPKSPTDYVYQFCHYDGKLIAGFGASMGCGQVWQFTPSQTTTKLMKEKNRNFLNRPMDIET